MSDFDIIRAWKDPEYRATLTQIPPLPIGLIDLDDPYLNEDLLTEQAAGKRGEHTSVFNCPTHTCACTSQCHTVEHCPHTGWQCKAV